MRSAFFLEVLLVALLALASVSAFGVERRVPGNMDISMNKFSLPAATKMFQAFKDTFGKLYHTKEEESKRFENFLYNLYHMNKLNAANPNAKFSINRLFDLSPSEYNALYANGEEHFAKAVKENKELPRAGLEQLRAQKLQRAQRNPLFSEKTLFEIVHEEGMTLNEMEKEEFLKGSQSSDSESSDNVSDYVDWRLCGAVTEVKDQGQCGSCWAFSTVGNIEAQWYLAKGELVRLSEQQLVSCDKVDGACQGGLMENAYTWLIQNRNGYVYTEESYPYTSGDGSVERCSDGHVWGGYISGFTYVEENETVIEAYLAEFGPLAIAVDATAFLSYSGGILENCHASRLNHGVLLVGYNNSGPIPYWIIKNSWGTSWGEDGYIRVKKGTNECLIQDYVVSALIPDEAPPQPVTTTTSTLPPGKAGVRALICTDYFCGDCESEDIPTNVCFSNSVTVPNMKDNDSYKSILVQAGATQVIFKYYADENCKSSPTISAYTLNQCLFSLEGSTQFTRI